MQVITELERLENFNVRGNKIDPRLTYLPHARQRTINIRTGDRGNGPRDPNNNTAARSVRELGAVKHANNGFNGDFNVKSDYSHRALAATLTLYNEWGLHPLKH